MSANDVKQEILAPMQKLYLPPRQMPEPDQIGALQQYVQALNGFGGDALKVAWQEVRDKWLKLSWPPPALFVQAARRAAGAGKSNVRIRLEEKQRENGVRWSRWLAARTSDLGQRAAREGFAFGLKMHILEEGKTAEQFSVAEALAHAATARRNVENLKPGGIGDAIRRMAARRDVFELEAAREIDLACAERSEHRAAPQQLGFNPAELL